MIQMYSLLKFEDLFLVLYITSKFHSRSSLVISLRCTIQFSTGLGKLFCFVLCLFFFCLFFVVSFTLSYQSKMETQAYAVFIYLSCAAICYFFLSFVHLSHFFYVGGTASCVWCSFITQFDLTD